MLPSDPSERRQPILLGIIKRDRRQLTRQQRHRLIKRRERVDRAAAEDEHIPFSGGDAPHIGAVEILDGLIADVEEAPFGDIQALQMYSYSSSYGIATSTTTQTGHENTPWLDGRQLAVTGDDGVVYGTDFSTSNPEWILDAAIRQNRYTLDGCIRSNGGANADKLMSYITMPGERDHVNGPLAGLYPPNTFLRDWERSYYWVSNDAIRRILMLSRSRGVKEYVVWSYNHANTEYTWRPNPAGRLIVRSVKHHRTPPQGGVLRSKEIASAAK
ncbi:MAG: hypothetical protein K2Y21_13380 [Phycisphaerales bacterium]|nr:hypothetical protein [Phycisphaerales bacterium]